LPEETVVNARQRGWRQLSINNRNLLFLESKSLVMLHSLLILILRLSPTPMSSNVDGDEAEFSAHEVDEIHQELLSGSGSM
jgi:hypothetical protein